MEIRLDGKRAIVCGSTQGIGKAIAVELALSGAHVTLVARNEEKLKDVVGQLSDANGQRHAYLVADFDAPGELKRQLKSQGGDWGAEILINNTGGPPAGLAIDAAETDFLNAFNRHLICNHLLVQACLPAMKRNRYGRIINVISTSVKVPIPGLGVSNTIRGAVANWSKTLAQELGPYGITVNNLLPGSIMTGRLESIFEHKARQSGKTVEQVIEEAKAEIPAGRIGETHEIAAAAAFLASPAAGYISGINMPVDGGRTPSL